MIYKVYPFIQSFIFPIILFEIVREKTITLSYWIKVILMFFPKKFVDIQIVPEKSPQGILGKTGCYLISKTVFEFLLKLVAYVYIFI